ncbi:ROK family protein [Dactylosporangium matsuzakiense]|uniref:MarR family transcriptional regulator n=1 Tax=Dactylosporangium matsuzakiense TaxID=53360 RepID=A0A9W6KMX7_9ACTN|nr:ROK family protein [Dactylosporangium matsuzakiense]GLL02259.1 MarR family transcriptional regulator [Dactylosporangium matsuzakiense]
MAHEPAVLSAGELAVTRHLLTHGPASRGHLGDTLRLSVASMSRLARSLVAGGILVEDLEPQPGIGRPRQILSVLPGARHVVGCKLTGDTAYGVVCDIYGDVKATARAALPPGTPFDGTVRVIAQLAGRLARRVPSVDGIGVSLGGVVTDRSVVREGTFLGWHDVDLGAALRERLGGPVVVANDVTALARAELWFGAGRSHTTFGLLTIGAGLGFGVVREGVVVESLVDNGHLLAHAPVTGSGPRCSLGHRGCVAAYLNRDDLERHAGLPFDDLVAARTAGDATATALLDAAARALGHTVATFAGALQTTRIVLAGEDAAAITDSPAVAATIAERLRPGPDESQRCRLDITTAPLTFTDWARGAAVTGIQHVLGAL